MLTFLCCCTNSEDFIKAECAFCLHFYLFLGFFFFFFFNSPYSFIKEILFAAWLFLREYKIFKSIILVWVALGAEQEIDLNANTGLAKKCI